MLGISNFLKPKLVAILNGVIRFVLIEFLSLKSIVSRYKEEQRMIIQTGLCLDFYWLKVDGVVYFIKCNYFLSSSFVGIVTGHVKEEPSRSNSGPAPKHIQSCYYRSSYLISGKYSRPVDQSQTFILF